MLSGREKGSLGATKPVLKAGASSISPKTNAEGEERTARSIVAAVRPPAGWDCSTMEFQMYQAFTHGVEQTAANSTAFGGRAGLCSHLTPASKDLQ